MDWIKNSQLWKLASKKAGTEAPLWTLEFWKKTRSIYLSLGGRFEDDEVEPEQDTVESIA